MIRRAFTHSLAAFAALAAAGVLARPAAKGTIAIEQPWARETAQGQSAGGGFMTIANRGRADDRLTGGSTPVAAEIQIHMMRMDGGVMRMRRMADGLPIPAGGSVQLRPGSYHVMFMGLRRPLRRGELVPATLHFARAGKVAVSFRVEAVTHSGPSAGGGAAHDGP